MSKIYVLLFTSAILALCDSAAIGILEKVEQKCDFKDIECKQKLFVTMIHELIDNGVPELDIPKLDPYDMKNQVLELLGMIRLTLVDGKATGLKTCKTTVFEHDIENAKTNMEVICDTFAIEGDYKIEHTAAFEALSGGIKVHGEGHGSIVLDKLKLNIETPYELVKGADGEVHVKVLTDDAVYSFEVLDKATFSGDHVFIGSQDISSVLVNIANEYWKPITKSLGKNVLDKGVSMYYKLVTKFFDEVPLSNFISDDLSSYVKS